MAIDFSVAAAVERNVAACVHAQVPLVEGTTGWQSQQSAVFAMVADQGGALIYGANFSVGVNLFYRVVARAGELFAQARDYAPFIEEAHHQQKRDAPSGTALRLRDLLKERNRARDSHCFHASGIDSRYASRRVRLGCRSDNVDAYGAIARRIRFRRPGRGGLDHRPQRCV